MGNKGLMRHLQPNPVARMVGASAETEAFATAPYTLRLMGEFRLSRSDEALGLIYEKSRALLAWLVLNGGRQHARDALAELFWPNLDRRSALTNLRQVIGDLRVAFATGGDAHSPLLVSRNAVGIDWAALAVDVRSDLKDEPACPPVPDENYCRGCIDAPQTTAAALGTELLPDLRLRGCDEYDRWLQIQRELVRRRRLERQLRLADCLAARGETDAALTAVRTVLDLEPLHEDAVRRLVALYAGRGETAIAVDTYKRFRDTLQQDYGLAPTAQTRMLFERVCAEHTVPPPECRDAPLVERRQVGVLACELGRCEALAAGSEEDIDAAETRWRQLVESERIVRAVLDRYGTRIVQARGGSLLAYFGAGGGSEHSLIDAIGAALEIRRRLASEQPTTILRQGVHAGPLLCGDPRLPDPEGLASGCAAALAQQASVGEIFVSATGWAQADGYYTASAIPLAPTHTARLGASAYRIDAVSGAGTRLAAAQIRGRLLPLCGRRRELAALDALWRELLRERRAGGVLLRGEPGIGKSRLALALKEAVKVDAGDTAAARIRHLHCSAEHTNTPFHPFARWLDDPEAAAGANPRRSERDDSPEMRRARHFARLLDAFAAEDTRGPLLLLIDDLQWADPSSLELIDRLLQGDGSRLLCLTARPEFSAPWPADRCREIGVERLAEDDLAALVAAALPGDVAVPASADLVRLIVLRADGVPLYAEELAHSLPQGRAATLPATLIDLLSARIDAAGEARPVLAIAAVIGREFDLALLRRCCLPELDAAAVDRALARLAALRLLELAGDPPRIGRFRHALIRDAAYRMQTQAGRAEVHSRIADELRRHGAAPELLARHQAAAGAAGAALAARLQAGRLAARQAACREAVAHFRVGLELLPSLANTRTRATRELELTIGLGAAACAADGYASQEGAAAYARAMARCNAGDVEARDESFVALWGLWASASSRVGYRGARDLAEQLRRLAAHSADPILAQQAHFAVGNTAYWQGEFATALHHLEQVEARWQPTQHARHIELFGEDAGVTAAAYRGWILQLLGRPDAARAAANLAVARAHDLGHPFSEAYALAFAALLHGRWREPDAATSLAARTLALAERHGFVLWRLVAQIVQGAARAMQGDAKGAESIRDCVDGMRAAMGGVTVAVLVPLAEALLDSRRDAEARTVIDEAKALAALLGDGHALAELARQEGLARARCGDRAGATSAFHRGQALAHRQGTPLTELRLALARIDCRRPLGPTPAMARHLAELVAVLSPHGDCAELVRARAQTSGQPQRSR